MTAAGAAATVEAAAVEVGRALSGRARVAGVIGWPVAHSLSPRLHGYWLAQHRIDGAYVPLAVRPEDIADAIRGLARLGFAGANVTLPHKEAALAAADRADADARAIGAANTLVIGEDGAIEARNTDGFGFLEHLKQAAAGWRADAGPAVVLGAGGAARAIVHALVTAGCPELRLVNRTRHRAEALAAGFGGRVRPVAWEAGGEALAGAALLVNTTTLGMAGAPELRLDLALLPATAIVADIVYVPRETPLLRRARARGLLGIDGLGMLLHQARPGFAAWFGLMPEVTPELAAYVSAGLPRPSS
jgi:shikimate dehydrogenase